MGCHASTNLHRWTARNNCCRSKINQHFVKISNKVLSSSRKDATSPRAKQIALHPPHSKFPWLGHRHNSQKTPYSPYKAAIKSLIRAARLRPAEKQGDNYLGNAALTMHPKPTGLEKKSEMAEETDSIQHSVHQWRPLLTKMNNQFPR